ncbi:MAG: uracil-DNA glycosylase [Fibromonadaceae bacterium]|nr:uracil-DNA glycosylase [Fibromonadaceae bacterium]
MIKLENSWLSLLADLFETPWFAEIKNKVVQEKQQYTVYPPAGLFFNAMDLCPVPQTKVVILGQDPYHGTGQAHGLSFSVPFGIEAPPSLQNIYKELERDLGIKPAMHGNLESWAKQGVLLLNSSLSVRANSPASHFHVGWEKFTDSIIERVSKHKTHLVFLLWGSFARKKKFLITGENHLVLEAPHPSPLSAHRGFIGCGHFSKANSFLQAHELEPICWQLPASV